MLKRTSLVFAALAALGTGCSLINAYDDVLSSGGGGTGAQGGAGGATSTSTTTTGTAMGGGGMGGGGGMPPTFACQPYQNPVEILTPGDLDDTTEIDEQVSVAFDDQGYTHVMVTSHMTRQIVVRTVRDNELGPIVKYPATPSTQDNRGFQLLSVGNKVRVLAKINDVFQVLEYTKNNGQIPMGAPSVITLATPMVRCDPPVEHEKLIGALDGMQPWVVGSCRDTMTGELTVFGNEVSTNSVRFQYTGLANDPMVRPAQYARVNGVNVLITSGENPQGPGYGAFLRAGVDGNVSNTPIPIQVEQGKATFPFAVVPGIGATPSVFALIASLDPQSPTFTPATLFAGIVDGMEVANLAMSPMSLLDPALDFPNQSAITFVTPPSPAFGQYVSAGINLFDPNTSKVFLQWWDPEAHLLTNSVINQIDDPAGQGRHIYAAAGRGNQVFYYVVWVLEDPMSRYHVFGQRVSCDQVVN